MLNQIVARMNLFSGKDAERLCFDTTGGDDPMVDRMKTSKQLTVMISAILLAFALPAGAAPMFVGNPYTFTDNFGPNTAGFVVGHYFFVGARVADPLGVPDNIDSAEALALTAGQSDYTLNYVSLGSILQGTYQTVTPYVGQVGQWRVEFENEQGETAAMETNVLDKPRVIPLAMNLEATGSSLAPTISWDAVLFDDDLDSNTPDVEVDFYVIRLLNSVNDQFYRSPLITGNSFTVPAGLIVPGLTTIRLEAKDFDDDGRQENRSDTFTQFIAVPEPTTFALMGLGLAGIGYRWRKQIKAA